MQPMLPPILYEDETLIAFDKPSGLPVAPDRWNPERACLMNLIHTHRSPKIFNAHRIDKETSGILLCAANRAALTDLRRQFENHQVEKRYLALVRSAPRENELLIDQGLRENPERPGIMQIVPDRPGHSRTHIKVLERWRGYALLEARPLTDRAHQIRVHLAFAGCPILADRLYGMPNGLMLSDIKTKYKPKAAPERPLLGRLALHAAGLTITHPVTHQPLTIQAALPDDFQMAIKYLKKFAGL